MQSPAKSDDVVVCGLIYQRKHATAFGGRNDQTKVWAFQHPIGGAIALEIVCVTYIRGIARRQEHNRGTQMFAARVDCKAPVEQSIG